MEEHFTEFEYDLRDFHEFNQFTITYFGISLLTLFYMNYIILRITITNFEKQ